MYKVPHRCFHRIANKSLSRDAVFPAQSGEYSPCICSFVYQVMSSSLRSISPYVKFAPYYWEVAVRMAND